MVKICSTEYPVENEDKYKSHFNKFNYPLSSFQKYAIESIVDGNHVLVTAHTGSGKTLPAEFAIQHFVGMGKKVVYCSPIKALSNQKYYEFTNKYTHISFGIYTGDIKCNPNADVLIMTTEILMNYLFVYNNKKPENNNLDIASDVSKLDFNIDIQNELACVVFDEVHYINDKERGGVWERSLMMLPPKVQLVLLSATIDNPEGFSQWIETKRLGIEELKDNDKIVYLASTTHRIVPLTHYCFLTTTEAIFKGMKDKELEKQIRDNTNTLIKLQDEKGKFNDIAVQTISKTLKIFDTKQVYMKRQNVLNNLCLYLRDHEMLPALAFVFSRKHVELCAKEITIPLLEDDSKVPYTIRREAEQIIRKLPNFKEYLELPEYNSLVSLLEKGIGIHHSGMIPVLREIVELMISKKYIKLLFATESFAIGLDCPIKTCIFTSLTKFDGNGERYLLSHEYQQAAGRAGRRGLDTVGHVIHLNNLFKLPSLTEYRGILCGKPQELISKFHISYSLILNLLKNGQDCDFHKFTEKSMIQNELSKSIVTHKMNINELTDKINKKKEFIEKLRTPYNTCLKFIQLENSIKTLVNKKKKDAEKEMRVIQDEYRTLNDDLKVSKDYMQLSIDIENQNQGLKYMEGFIKEQTDLICQILIDEGFIEIYKQSTYFKDEDVVEIIRDNSIITYRMTPNGVIASNIAEINPLIITKVMTQWDYFQEFTPKQLIGLFSCFTDVKVPSDLKCSVPTTDDKLLKKHIEMMIEYYRYYEKRELECDVQTGLKYDDALNYDMIDLSMNWCECDNEHDCKYFIQNIVAEKSISIGDFTKAMLKIMTITKEIMNVCEQLGKIDLLHKLSRIEPMILKYVTTAQSLYI